MDPKRALIVSIVAAGLAIAVIAVDLAMNVEVELDSRIDGEWQTVAWHDGSYSRAKEPYFRCAPPDMRVTIENSHLWSVTERLIVTGTDYKGGTTILDEDITIPAGGLVTREFTVPEPDGNDTGGPEVRFSTWSVTVQFGDIWLSSCVEAA